MADSNKDKDYITDARARFAASDDAWSQVRDQSLADLKFSRLGEQWPDEMLKSREREARPALTINKMPAFIRQIVNDARQNKPAVTTRPVDSVADPRTSEIMNGLIRHIESASDADVAYDTAIESAVSGGYGFFAIDIDYSRDDTFDLDINVRRIGNPFSIHFDAHTEAADSSDWRYCFEIEMRDRKQFEADYPGAHAGEFSDDDKVNPWFTEDQVRIAAYWDRYEQNREVLKMSNGDIVDAKAYKKQKATYDAAGLVVEGSRNIASWAIKHTLMTGNDILEQKDWAGSYIPIVPVYGEEVNIEGRRHFRSLIRDSKDAQRMYNYWRTAATEMVALAPKAPWLAEEGSTVNPEQWETANTEAYQVLYHKQGSPPPQRQVFDSSPVGSIQQSLSASDDMKAIMGMHDASLGARSNETSGRAIMARQREGDVSTFHFQDNLTRAIRCGGRIMLDLIPKVYNTRRMIRILGADEKPQPAMLTQLGGPSMGQEVDEQTQEMMEVFDLTVGKYDLIVKAGPSFTSRREEAATQMMEMGRVAPQFFEVAGDILARNLDWPGAEEIADRLEKMLPPGLLEGPEGQLEGPPPPSEAELQMQAMMQKTDAEIQIDSKKAEAKAGTDREVALFEAETARMVEASGQQTQPGGIDAEMVKHQDEIALQNKKMELDTIQHEQSLIQKSRTAIILKSMDINASNQLTVNGEIVTPQPAQADIEGLVADVTGAIMTPRVAVMDVAVADVGVNEQVQMEEYPTEEQAVARANELGGSGFHSHTMDDGVVVYMPFATHEEYEAAIVE